jgi:hypothetical protein
MKPKRARAKKHDNTISEFCYTCKTDMRFCRVYHGYLPGTRAYRCECGEVVMYFGGVPKAARVKTEV